jgi:hypothetical protein
VQAVKSVEIELRWKDVESVSGTAYCFPSELSRYLKSHYDKPGIYRWAVLNSEERLVEAYVGETESCKRLYQYLRPGKKQQTNFRLKAELDRRVASGLNPRFQTLEFEHFRINGLLVDPTSLGNPHVRKLLEALAVNENRCIGCKVLNAGEDRLVKRLSRTVLSLVPEKKAAFLDEVRGILESRAAASGTERG